MKRTLLIILITIIPLAISMTVSVSGGDSFTLSLLDGLFIVGMIQLIIGAFLYIFQKGFFNGIIYSLKRFRRSTSQGRYLSQFDDIDSTKEAHEEISAERSYKITAALLLTGILLLFISFLSSYLFYT
ncbi:DUF3899 domain-containing protein [Rossellomorea aquimaris]|uniref:DUF3899 domain-containing protein n=1 Tax=Rossellomorea aquimaris TaxID=189382 RepID=UPI001CD52929|nr:DUF3899 domain-containing protein [Rossellomorea aquimaris]MCA1056744.1 DUF3899 domain-containing protein [Rossellomorea aquimaris]